MVRYRRAWSRSPMIGAHWLLIARCKVGYMQYDESFDFVIVGSGAASVPAALAAKSLGRSALIIEKQKVFGGSTAFSGGVAWIPNSPLHGAHDSEEEGRKYLNGLIGADGGKASPPASARSS